MSEVALVPDVPTKKILLDRAFAKASKRAAIVRPRTGNPSQSAGSAFREAEAKKWAAREKENIRIGIAGDILVAELETIVTETFSFDELTPFYQDLVSALIDVDQFKKSLGALKWAGSEIKKLKSLYTGRLRNARDFDTMSKQRIQFYGLASATVDKVKKDLAYLADCRALLSELPNLKEVPTVVIAGMPNVGKSSLLAALTGSKPEVQPYPFTTKGLMVSYKEGHYGDVQIVDTPGLLDRPLKDRNNIEKKAIAALKSIASVIVYVYDPTDAAYALEQQESLFKEIKATYKLPIIAVYNKCDMKRVGGMSVSATTGEGLEGLWKETLRLLYKKRG